MADDELLDDVLEPGGDAIVPAPPPPAPVVRPVPHGTLLVPARQAVAVAATTFAAGAVAVALAHRRRASRAHRSGGLSLGRVVAAETFIVDVRRVRR